jgi:hypothetical protein
MMMVSTGTITLDNSEMTTNLEIGSCFGKMEVSMKGSLYMK